MSEDRNETESQETENQPKLSEKELLENERKEKAKQKRLETKEAKKNTEIAVTRKMKGDKTVHHDLHKLLIAKVKKNVGIDPEKPMIVESDHSHFFHSIDSNGRSLKYCHPAAGHIHKIEWGYIERTNKNGIKFKEPKISRVGPPVHSISAKKGNDIPIDPKNRLKDGHTHLCEYLDSELIYVRKNNPEAVELMAARAKEDAEYFNSNFKTS